jgi:hypothetical protein
VIARQKARDAWGLEHPELLIRVEGQGDLVKASLVGDSSERIPDDVSFYYSGDPTKEVRLREETNPLGPALFLLVAPLVGAAVLAHFERRRRRSIAPVAEPEELGPA